MNFLPVGFSRKKTNDLGPYAVAKAGKHSLRRVVQLLQQETLDWKERTEQFRLQEWALHEEMLQAAWAAAREVRQHPNRVSLHGLVKLYELASTLGRRAAGVPLDHVRHNPKPVHP